MNKCALVAVLATGLLSPVVVADGGSGNPMGEEYTHPMGADLGAICQPSIPPSPCVSGSTSKVSFWKHRYCICLDGKPMMTKERSEGACAAYSQGNNYFWASEAASNKLCACPGYGDRICTSQFSVHLPGAPAPESSNLKCMNNHKCKVDMGNFCNPENGKCVEAGRLQQPCFGAPVASDCDYPHAGCGPISHRCVPRSVMIPEGYLSIEAGKGSPEAVEAAKRLKKSSLDNIGDFRSEGWADQLTTNCERAGLTNECKPQSSLVVT